MKPKFEPGDIVAFRLDDGRALLLRVVGHDTNAETGDSVGVLELVNWIGTDIPDEESIARMPALDWEPGERFRRPYCPPLVIGQAVRGRLSVVGHFEPPRPPTRKSRRFGLLPRVEQGWHLALPVYLRWDSLPAYALHLLGEGPDPDE